VAEQQAEKQPEDRKLVEEQQIEKHRDEQPEEYSKQLTAGRSIEQ
jgi:hypothetical protein